MHKQKHSYFNRDGVEVSEQEALRGGNLQNGYSLRVPTLFRDARTVFDSGRVVVSDGGGGSSGNRAGFRRVLDNDLGRDDKAAALREVEAYLRDAYKTDARKTKRYNEGGQSEGYFEREEDPKDREQENPASDQRTIEQIAADHLANMARVYDSYAKEISNAWRNAK